MSTPTGDRRDPELAGIKKRLAVVEHDQNKQDLLVTSMHYALFGLPDDRLNNGLVGEVHDMKQTLDAANAKLVALLITAICAVTALGLDILTRHL